MLQMRYLRMQSYQLMPFSSKIFPDYFFFRAWGATKSRRSLKKVTHIKTLIVLLSFVFIIYLCYETFLINTTALFFYQTMINTDEKNAHAAFILKVEFTVRLSRAHNSSLCWNTRTHNQSDYPKSSFYLRKSLPDLPLRTGFFRFTLMNIRD